MISRRQVEKLFVDEEDAEYCNEGCDDLLTDIYESELGTLDVDGDRDAIVLMQVPSDQDKKQPFVFGIKISEKDFDGKKTQPLNLKESCKTQTKKDFETHLRPTLEKLFGKLPEPCIMQVQNGSC